MVLPPGDPGDFGRVSDRQQMRMTRYGIEGLNSFATVLYFNYLYFFMRAQFGFNDRQNLALAALLGLFYAIIAWQAGKVAHRLGYFNTLKLGFGVMLAGLIGRCTSYQCAGSHPCGKRGYRRHVRDLANA